MSVYNWTIHGGRLSSAQVAFPQAPTPWLDLSTGINPDVWPGVGRIGIDWHRLPDDAALHALEAAAAVHFGANGPAVCALPGTEFGLRSLRQLSLPEPFRHASPGYRTHGEAFPGSRPISHGALIEEAAKGGTILLANPTNPDGRLMAAGEVFALAEVVSRAGGWLVVDEAFIDAHDAASVVPLLTGSEPVVVLRSFGKFFGLAGLRLGFAVGPHAIITAWRGVIGSWPLSAAAIGIGAAAYADRTWIEQMKVQLAERALAFDQVLRRHGLEPLGHCPLFRLVKGDAASRFNRLAGRGILTRPFDYDAQWLRFGVPMDADLTRVDEALGDV